MYYPLSCTNKEEPRKFWNFGDFSQYGKFSTPDDEHKEAMRNRFIRRRHLSLSEAEDDSETDQSEAEAHGDDQSEEGKIIIMTQLAVNTKWSERIP